MPPQIFTFDAKAASSQAVEKVVDHNGRDHFRINDKATKLTLAISPEANSTIFGTDLRTLCGFHFPEAGWRGTRGSGIKWDKSKRRWARSADRAACLVPSFLLLSGRQRLKRLKTPQKRKGPLRRHNVSYLYSSGSHYITIWDRKMQNSVFYGPFLLIT